MWHLDMCFHIDDLDLLHDYVFICNDSTFVSHLEIQNGCQSDNRNVPNYIDISYLATTLTYRCMFT